MKKLLLLSLLLSIVTLFVVFFVSAGSTCLTIKSKTTSAYLKELSSLNAQLSTCTISVPANANFIVKDGNILVSIAMNSGVTEQFYITISNQKLTAFTKGTPSTYTHQVALREDTFNKILQSNDALNEVLIGIKNKDIVVRANTFFGKIKWFFAKFFLPKPQPAAQAQTTTSTLPINVPAGPVGKPDNCDETYLPGHREYASNKVLWDRYSSDTDKVCQSQRGRPQPSPCVYVVQLSISGTPYTLCWYNE